MNERIVITVDGLAGSGKTAISRRLAEQLGYVHLSTGMVYRAVGYLALQHGLDPDSPEPVNSLLSRHKLELRLVQKKGLKSATIYLDDQDLGAAVFTPEVSEATSICSRHAMIRSALYNVQREAFPGENLVAEGRDMGTVVFPDALMKFFIEVSPEIRVSRRIAQMYGDVSVLNSTERARIEFEMMKEIKERDERDSSRQVAPTVAATDAVKVDNSLNSLDEVVKQMVKLVKARLPS